MKYSTRFSDAAHILVFIHLKEIPVLSSANIAYSIQTNPAYVRQLMAKLKKAGLLLCSRGRARPQLAKKPKDISLLDIYQAIEGETPLLHLDTHTNPKCGVGINIQLALQDCYNEVQKAAQQRMETITLQSIIDQYHKKIQEQQEV